MQLSLAWKNLWRNTRRTVITMVALTLGVAGIVGLHSYRDTVYDQLTQDITRGLIGHLQVHGKGYQEAPDIGILVRNPVAVEAKVLEALPGATSERRVLGAGLGGSKDQSAPVMIVGLLPRPGDASLHTIVQGRDLSPEPRREAVVGKDLALDLGVGVGDELVLVSQAADGSVANDRYTIVGTSVSSSAELDATSVILHIKDAQDFFVLQDGVHQLVVRLPPGRDDVGPPVASVRAALDLATLEALGWTEMLPELKATMRQKEQGQHIMDFIVFLIVGLGVVNAMTMSTFERMREFGVVLAIGTRPSRLLSLVLTEALLQAAISFVAGVALATAILYGIGTVDLSSLMEGDMMGARMPGEIALKVSGVAVASAAITAFATMLLGGLLPAIRASRLRPVEAMRHT